MTDEIPARQRHCGESIPVDYQYCPWCGARLTTDDRGKTRAEAAVETFKHLIQTAETTHVGTDTEYVPDGPHAREGHPNATGDGGGQIEGGAEECPHCWGTGVEKRRCGTAGPGPAKRVKRRTCRQCDGTGIVHPQDTDDTGGET